MLRHATSRWGSLVLIVLKTGTHRFSELRRKIGGVSERMLAQTLQALEGDGFVRRVSLPVVPPHVEYSLTPLGSELAGKVAELAEWVEVNMPRIAELKGAVQSGRALQRATGGAALGARKPEAAFPENAFSGLAQSARNAHPAGPGPEQSSCRSEPASDPSGSCRRHL